MRRSKRKTNSAYARGADDQQKRVRESNQNTSTPKTRAQSQTPPEQAANRPTLSQPVSIYTRQQAETPISPSVTFTETSTSAGINPNDYLRFETNDVHIVQSVHSFLGSHVSQTNRTKIVSGQYINLAILSENTNSENNDKQVVLIDGVLSTKEKNKQTMGFTYDIYANRWRMCSISYYFRNSSASINNVTNVNYDIDLQKMYMYRDRH